MVFDGLTITGGRTTAMSQRGGAIRANPGTDLNFIGTTVSGNSTAGTFADAGGIYAFDFVTLTNSTVSGNQTEGSRGFGGGISALKGITLTNSTVSGNRTLGDGSGGGGIESFGIVSLTNSIVLGNASATTATDEIDSLEPVARASSLIGGDAGVTVAGVFKAVDPGTGGGRLADNGGSVRTIALLDDAANPALDRGDSSLVPAGLTTDARGAGFARISGGTVDMGAFELQRSGPQAVADVAETSEARSVVLDVLANDAPSTGASLVGAVIAGAPQFGRVLQADGGRLVYLPETGFQGQDGFTYELLDSAGGRDQAEFVVEVKAAARSLDGTSGPDTHIGDGRAELLHGQGGDDAAFGLSGNDALFGGTGADGLDGGRGADILHGGIGGNYLLGGGAADLFVVETPPGAGLDIILDFSIAQGDRVLLAVPSLLTPAGFVDGNLVRLTGASPFRNLEVDLDGAGGNGFTPVAAILGTGGLSLDQVLLNAIEIA